jgi:hypothetical protein
MHTSVPSPLRFAIACSCAVFLGAALPAAAAPKLPKVYRFTSTATNTADAIMTLDHPSLNGKPTLRLIVTQYSAGVLNPHPVGVYYDARSKKWHLTNEDQEDIPLNAMFNVMVAQGSKPFSVTPSVTDGILAFFPTQKGNPNAKLLTTHVVLPNPKLDGVLQPNNIGLFYIQPSNPPRISSGRWSIYQENLDSNVAAIYNIADVTNLKIGSTPISFRHGAVAGNTTDNATTITSTLTDGKPDAVLFVQHVYTQTANKDVDEVLAVTYAGGKWKIIAQDTEADLPKPSEYNVVVFPSVTP